MNANALKEPRRGVTVHYTAGTYASSVDWCKNPASKVSYNVIIGPKGEVGRIVPWHLRAWHAGVCRTSDAARLPYRDANSACEGVALSGGPTFGPPTEAQVERLVVLLRERFRAHGWGLDEGWRIVGHDTEAWPRGRKCDPTGPDASRPWLDLDAIRRRVAMP